MRSSRSTVGVLFLLIGMLLPSLAPAQQIGGGPVQRAPVFGETGMVHERAGFVVGAAYGRAKKSAEFFDITDSAVLVGGSFGLTDWLTVGATVPYLTSSFQLQGEPEDEVSGIGNAALHTRVRVFGAGDEGVRAAVLASAVFPTAADELAPVNSFLVALGGGLSYAADPVSFHAAAEVELASDENIQETINYSASFAFRPADQIVLSGEFVGVDPRGGEESEGSDAAGYGGVGARVFLGSDRNLYIDGGALFGLTDEAFDNLWSVGVGFAR